MSSLSKSWKEYFLDFLMVFLAVTLGFFADRIRENNSEKSKEKEYIISMIEDAEKDKVNIEAAITSNQIRILHLDSLAALCSKYNPSENKDRQLYHHYRFGLLHPDFITPTERTIQQLKNAGGMRLIRKRKAIDIIVAYDNFNSTLSNQQFYYEKYQNNAIEKGIKFFDFEKFHFTKPPEIIGNDYYKLINNNKVDLMEFANIVTIYSGVAKYYGRILNDMDTQADTLIKILNQEYSLN